MEDRIKAHLRGVAVGAAVGDALGMPLEFGLASPADHLIRTMQPGRLPAGSFTDDTEMALALAESLLQNPALDAKDLASRFVTWYRSNPPDVGIHTSSVLARIASGEPWEQAAFTVQSRQPDNAGNGSVMRCWPVAICYWNDMGRVLKYSHLQSRVTHSHPECLAACAFINAMIVHLVHGLDPWAAYESAIQTVELPTDLKQTVKLAPHRKREELRNTGWVRHTVESALWGLLTTTSFEDALVRVINLGADADTAGAVAGALAGAAYGLDSIPLDWQNSLRGEWPLQSEKLWHRPEFVELADQLANKTLTAKQP